MISSYFILFVFFLLDTKKRIVVVYINKEKIRGMSDVTIAQLENCWYDNFENTVCCGATKQADAWLSSASCPWKTNTLYSHFCKLVEHKRIKLVSKVNSLGSFV